mgnify:CR=1 FL=1
MVFQLGNNANPLGRPKRRNVISEDYQTFCRDHQDEIKKVGQLVLERALVEKEPWAMKLCMEYFYPKPERSVAITKEETTDLTMTMDDRLETWSAEDKQTFLKIWMKNKRGLPAFESSGTSIVKEDGMRIEGEVIEEGEKDSVEEWR